MVIKMSTPRFGEHEVLIDDEDYEKFKEYSWMLWSTPRHSSIYVVTSRTKKCPKQKRLHRFLLGVEDPKIIVDHINGNCLDNRKCNLRITDSGGNNKNAFKRKNAETSKFKGVHYIRKYKCQKAKRWVAQIQVNKKKMNLGYFHTEIEAAKAYNEAALRYFGEFAKLNQIPEESK